uniref:Si:ch211-214j8.12 n=1 Tax=Seriola dumerili TaxID=41447 RepID=A0A3B4V6K7_SERDU
MPLFRALGEGRQSKPRAGWTRVKKWMGSCRKTDEDGSIPSLTRLCLLSLADNMKEVWVKDYADNYLDQYSFRHIMGPFSLLPGRLVEELTGMLCTRKQLSRAALHLLLVPQLRGLSLDRCPGLVTSALCGHIAARCQGLWSLDLSGAQQLPSKVLSQTICCLPALRSLSLAGMHCDGCVIRTIAQRCCFLRHLDVSRCHFLSPAALLPLGGGDFCSSSATLDIGFGEQEGDRVAAAAYLLLSLPDLERVAMEGLTQAWCLIEHRKFSQTDEFTEREGIPRLNQVWREWRHRQSMDRRKREGAEGEEEERILWEGYDGECEEDSNRDEGPSVSLNQAEKKKGGGVLSQSSDEHLILRLKDVSGLTCDFLDSVGHLCPDIYSISVKVDDDEDTRGRGQGSVLAAGLQTWSGQLQSLSVHFLGPLVDLLPALQVTGSSLVSLTLEGVKTSPHTPLLEVIKACPRLRDLLIAAERPTIQEEEEEDQVDPQDDRDLPRLPNLRSLTLHFSDDHSQMMPFMLWMSLKKELKCLLSGSLLLEKLSLVSLPCPLNCVLQDVLRVGIQHRYLSAGSTDLPPMPLERVQHIDLQRTDVEMTTVKNIMLRSRRLKFVDLSHCWQISYSEWLNCKTFREVKVVWV